MNYEDGLYLNMTEEEYLAIERLSSSGIKKINESIYGFWSESWMNPDRKRKETPALNTGKAYHTMLLEGSDAFDRKYKESIKKENYGPGLYTQADLKSFAADNGLKQSGTVLELLDRVRDLATSKGLVLWHDVIACDENDVRLKIDGEIFDDIHRAQSVLHDTPSIRDAFFGGHPEVTILWTEPCGTQLKARIDYLKVSKDGTLQIVDLKTFSDRTSKSVQDIPGHIISRENYFVQPHVYMRAAKSIRYGCILPNTPSASFVREIRQNSLSTNMNFYWIFVRTGNCPEFIAKEHDVFDMTCAYSCKGESMFRNGLRLYNQCRTRFGSDPWIIDHGVSLLRDTDFPLWALEQNKEMTLGD